MDEKERAAQHQAAKDRGDEGQWGEPIAGKPRRRLGSMVSVRFQDADMAVVRAQAQRAGMSVSDYIRSRALGAALPGVNISNPSYPTNTTSPGYEPTLIFTSSAA